MRSFVLLACLLLTPSLALAEPANPIAAETATMTAITKPSRYVQAGFMVGAATPVVAPNLMAAIDGGFRLSDGPVWLHTAASWGSTGDDQGSGSNLQLRAGIEGRTCWWRDRTCTVGGIDAGYQRGHWSDHDDPTHSESLNALVAVPRFGVDLGGRHLRARAGMELDLALLAQRDVRRATGGTSATSPGIVGFEMNAGIAYQW
jgi:hypothetical protein